MLIIKGFIIGIGKILPGVSGALLAISLGLYKEILNKITCPFKKENIIFFAKLGLGFIIALVLFSNAITFFYNKYYLPTMLLFIGLILGGEKSLYLKITNKKHLIYSASAIIFMILLTPLLSFKINNINNFFTALFLGAIESLTSIIPGISGTAIYITLGVYDKILHVFSNMFNINLFFYNFSVLFPFAIGLVLVTLLLAKLFNSLFERNESLMYSLVFGFSLYTIFIMFFKTIDKSYSVINIIISLIMLIIGYKVAGVMEKN